MAESHESLHPETNNQPNPISSHMEIKRVIGVMSSKGGVGKSFCTGLLASELSRAGFHVGILDADLTGPSISMLFGVRGPIETGHYSFLPLQSKSGIKIISPNLLVEDGTQPFIWKSALAGKVIQELYKEVEWGELDYLIVDLPPAVSEVTVEVLQSIPFTGVVIVTQPEELSIRMATKAVRLSQKMNVDIIGVIENKSYFLAQDSNEKQYLFGPSHIDSLSAVANSPILATLPYSPIFSSSCDKGEIENILLPEGHDLMDAICNSLERIEMENIAHPKEMAVPSAEKPQVDNVGEDVDTSSQQDAYTGQPFSDIVVQLIRNKDNVGTFNHPDAQGYFLGSCGDRMQIDLQLVNNRILGARFMADGCGVTIACGSMITKMACSKTLQEAEKITPDELTGVLGGLPEDHLHCAELAVMTLREAIIDAVEGHEKKK